VSGICGVAEVLPAIFPCKREDTCWEARDQQLRYGKALLDTGALSMQKDERRDRKVTERG